MPNEEIRKKYGIDELLRQIPNDRCEFFSSFVPWAEDLEGWRLSGRELEPGPQTAVRTQLRTIWDDPKDRDARILIDVLVCASAAEALETLAVQLEHNQLALLPKGPPDLGLVSFVHPEPAPPTVYFVRGNLSIMVASFGGKAIPVLAIAWRLSARLAERPFTERHTLFLAADPARGKAGQDIALSYQTSLKVGDDGYWKFFVTGGTAVRRGDRLVLRSDAPRSIKVDAFLVESGREPYFGELSLTVE